MTIIDATAKALANLHKSNAKLSPASLNMLAEVLAEQIAGHCDDLRTHETAQALREYLSEINELPGLVENCLLEYDAVGEIARANPPLCYEMVRSNLTKSGWRYE